MLLTQLVLIWTAGFVGCFLCGLAFLRHTIELVEHESPEVENPRRAAIVLEGVYSAFWFVTVPADIFVSVRNWLRGRA